VTTPVHRDVLLRLGARRSPLARAQVDLVAEALANLGVHSTYTGVTTRGDVDRRELTEIGGTGVFATAVRDALFSNTIDVAVHSLKDLPTADVPQLQVAAVPRREDTRDVLIGKRLADLDHGDRVGTGAPRRALQLHDWARRRGLRIQVVGIRGNVDTRIELVRSGVVDAVVLAAAGLQRLGHLPAPENGRTDTVIRSLPGEFLEHAVMLPAPGQGALALEIHQRLEDELQAVVARLDDPVARAECQVERAFLATLEVGCTAPVGARATVETGRGKAPDLTLTAVIGRTLLSNLSEPANPAPILRWEATGSGDPAEFGSAEARKVLIELGHQSSGHPSSPMTDRTKERERSQ
jgi:hydroxymethylbilane synthase